MVKDLWFKSTMSKLICPRCEEGTVLHMRVIHTREVFQVCDECEAIWLDGQAVAVPHFDELPRFLRRRGRAPLWSSLENADR